MQSIFSEHSDFLAGPRFHKILTHPVSRSVPTSYSPSPQLIEQSSNESHEHTDSDGSSVIPSIENSRTGFISNDDEKCEILETKR